MTTQDVDRLKARRAAYKGHVTRVEKDIYTAISSPGYDKVKLTGLTKSYTDKIEKIKQVDEKILDIISIEEKDVELAEHKVS